MLSRGQRHKPNQKVLKYKMSMNIGRTTRANRPTNQRGGIKL
nr:MAG: hypothetical protein [Microvirus Sku211]